MTTASSGSTTTAHGCVSPHHLGSTVGRCLTRNARRKRACQVGNCIGRRNYAVFLRFLSCAALADAVLVAAAGLAVHANLSSTASASVGARDVERPAVLAAGVLGVYGLVLFVSLASLGGYHLRLVATNQTTNEHAKGAFGSSPSPLHRGCGANCANVCCREPRPPSALPCMSELVHVLEYARLRDSFAVYSPPFLLRARV